MQLMFNIKAVIFMCLSGSGAILANMISFVMIGKINERVPPSERISYIIWGTEVRRKYKELYPESHLTLLLGFCIFLMVACFPLMLWSMGIFSSVAR